LEKSYKEHVLKELAFLKDEPDIESDLFGFKIFASQLQNFLLDPNAPTPYTIGLHGEWGSGKTSLVYRIYKQISQKANNTDGSIENYKTIWFDAWEYEKLDPVLALMNRIALAYTGKNKQKFKQILKGLILKFKFYKRNQMNHKYYFICISFSF
jgi:predicted KAP-like P-loop ATPase